VRRIALAAVVCYGLLLVTGGAVRLTASGLGCPTWPSCYTHHLTAHFGAFHSLVEFGNRLVSVAVTVVSGLSLVATLRRRPVRRDLCWLAGGLVAGVVGQIVIGGLVVIFRLNPYLVAGHFLLTIPVLACAVILWHRAGLGDDLDPSRSVPIVTTELRWLSYLLLGALTIVTCIGSIVAGAGPHPGAADASGKPIPRIDIAFRDIAVLHSDSALFLIGLGLASLFAFHRSNVPDAVHQRLRLVFELMIIQGALGYFQYFLHDSPVIVEFHIAGLTCLWVAMMFFFLSLHEHPAKVVVVAMGDTLADVAPAT
jgi:cytochrome c oxidase assembly protein subunit 15